MTSTMSLPSSRRRHRRASGGLRSCWRGLAHRRGPGPGHAGQAVRVVAAHQQMRRAAPVRHADAGQQVQGRDATGDPDRAQARVTRSRSRGRCERARASCSLDRSLRWLPRPRRARSAPYPAAAGPPAVDGRRGWWVTAGAAGAGQPLQHSPPNLGRAAPADGLQHQARAQIVLAAASTGRRRNRRHRHLGPARPASGQACRTGEANNWRHRPECGHSASRQHLRKDLRSSHHHRTLHTTSYRRSRSIGPTATGPPTPSGQGPRYPALHGPDVPHRGIERRSACRSVTWERPPDALRAWCPTQQEDVHG
jgi:hypothetical protein